MIDCVTARSLRLRLLRWLVTRCTNCVTPHVYARVALLRLHGYVTPRLHFDCHAFAGYRRLLLLLRLLRLFYFAFTRLPVCTFTFTLPALLPVRYVVRCCYVVDCYRCCLLLHAGCVGHTVVVTHLRLRCYVALLIYTRLVVYVYGYGCGLRLLLFPIPGYLCFVGYICVTCAVVTFYTTFVAPHTRLVVIYGYVPTHLPYHVWLLPGLHCHGSRLRGYVVARLHCGCCGYRWIARFVTTLRLPHTLVTLYVTRLDCLTRLHVAVTTRVTCRLPRVPVAAFGVYVATLRCGWLRVTLPVAGYVGLPVLRFVTCPTRSFYTTRSRVTYVCFTYRFAGYARCSYVVRVRLRLRLLDLVRLVTTFTHGYWLLRLYVALRCLRLRFTRLHGWLHTVVTVYIWLLHSGYVYHLHVCPVRLSVPVTIYVRFVALPFRLLVITRTRLRSLFTCVTRLRPLHVWLIDLLYV